MPEATAAKYLRVLYTAPYRHRFVGFTELVINDGEYTKSVNNPTVEGAGTESKSSEKNNIADGNILSSYKATQDSGELIYHLSEKTESNHVRLISDILAGSSAHVWARTISKDGQTAWQDLGAVTTSFQTFQLANSAHLLDVKLKWEGGRPEFYEVSTYHAEIAETPNPDTPIPPVHKTTPDEGVQAPVVEQPRLDVVTEEVGFKTIERENPQLPKGTRKVVQEGKVGEKTTLVEVTIEKGKESSRVTRDSFVSKAPVDQIVEIGKPVEQVTPAEGVQALVVEQPRLDVVTEEVGFKTVERENPQLPKGTRKVVQEGKVGEKTTLVEVTIENDKESGRVTRDSFVSKVPVDQIVEIGSKEEKPSTPPVPSKPESDLRILTDKATKVQVIGTKATLDKVVSLKVKKVKAQNLEGKTYDAYDITLEDQDGQPIQPKGKVFVSLPLAANKEVEAVYTVKNAQQVDSLVFQQKGRYVEFMTGQLSVYAVVYKTSASQVQEEKPEIPSQDQTNKPASPQSQEAKPEAPLQTPERKETAVLPNTGTATDSAFLLGILTALTGLFLFKKREE